MKRYEYRSKAVAMERLQISASVDAQRAAFGAADDGSIAVCGEVMPSEIVKRRALQQRHDLKHDSRFVHDRSMTTAQNSGNYCS